MGLFFFFLTDHVRIVEEEPGLGGWDSYLREGYVDKSSTVMPTWIRRAPVCLGASGSA